MGLPRDYDPKKHGYPSHPKGGDSFALNLGGKPWASASLDVRQNVSFSCPYPGDPWRTLSLFRVSVASDGQVRYQHDLREDKIMPDGVRSVSITPTRPGQRLELRDTTGQPWGVVEIAEAIRLFDPLGRLRACITTTPGPLALQCWDEHGVEVAGREYLMV